jgi:hypothetical protein
MMMSTSIASRSFPTLRYLAAPFRWLFRSRRRVLTASAVLLAMIATPVIWWSIQLLGLPDIGDPFDLEAFRSFTIPDDRNAFVLYRQAADRLKPLDATIESSGARVVGVLPMVSGILPTETSGRSRDEKLDLLAAWSKADPRVRRWAEEDREALAIYRRGGERPDALDPNRERPKDARNWQALRSLHLLALLEASRLEEGGDMAGAWGWYRTALRASYHFGRYGYGYHRFVAQRWRDEIHDRLAAWSADPRTTPAMVRQALDEVIACAALAPSDSYTIQAEYPDLLRWLDSPDNPGRQMPLAHLYSLFGDSQYRLSPEHMRAILDVWRFWRREPERSRRVIRLAVANWLAYYDLPPERRPKPDPDLPGPLRFYALGPEAPAKARALPPGALDHWLATTVDAAAILRDRNPASIRGQEVRGYRALVVLLATELYRRDHGTVPLWDEALVGPYLKELPDDGLGDGAGPAGSAAVEATRARESNGRGK